MLSTTGFNSYVKVSEHELKVSDQLIALYEEYPGTDLGSWNRADWYSGRNWETGLTPELIPQCHNLLQDYAVNHTRLGIPLCLSGGSIHGIFCLGGSVLPTGIGLASSWNKTLLEAAFQMVAEEASTLTVNGGDCSGPTQDLARDPRWSRVEETYGEDPWLSGELSAAFCRGILHQYRTTGRGPRPAIRHFLAYGEPEGGHNSAPSHCGINELYNVHLHPFETAIKAGAENLMTSYNLVDGYPCTVSPLIQDLLRGQWGWKGTVVGDAGAIGNLVWQGFANDLGEAAFLAVKSGTDFCCWEADNFKKGLEIAFQRGDLTEQDLEPSLRRILGRKFADGLFEHPFIEDISAAAKTLSCPSHRRIAREAARESIVLLKNDSQLLPLKACRKIAVIGPNADNMHNQIGDYSAPQRPGDVITVRKGFEQFSESENLEVLYARGCGIRSLRREGFPEAVAAAQKADVVVLVLGGSSIPNMELAQADNGAAIARECLLDTEQDKDSGEGYDRAHLQFAGAQLDLLRELKACGKPIITVLIMGRPLILTEIEKLSDAVLLAWYPGMEGGAAIAETILGKNNPSGKLPITFPNAEGQIPVYYNALRNRSNYIDQPGIPKFRFGFGLSYTQFKVSDVRMEKTECTKDEVNYACASVTNTGEVEGAQVIQCYVRDLVFSIARPEFGELRGFEKVYLKPGETQMIRFPLGKRELGFYNRNLEFVLEPGKFLVKIGYDLDHLAETEFIVK